MKEPSEEITRREKECNRVFDSGEFDRALELADQAIAAARTNWEVARAQSHKASMLRDLHRPAEAAAICREALAKISREGDEQELAGSLEAELAMVLEDADERATFAARAIEDLSPSMPTAEGEDLHELSMLLALMHDVLGQTAECLSNYRTALRVAATPEQEINALMSLGAGLCEESPSVAAWRVGRADAHRRLAELHYDERDLARANKHATEAVAWADEETDCHVMCLMLLGHIRLAASDFEEARRFYQRVLKSPQANDDVKQSAREGLAMVEQYDKPG